MKPKTTKHKQFDPEALASAVILAKKTNNVRAAARMFGVPNSTLLRRIKNRPPKKRGPKTVLTADEEAHIADWVLYMARAGFPISATDLTQTVDDYAKKIRKTRAIPASFPSKTNKISLT